MGPSQPMNTRSLPMKNLVVLFLAGVAFLSTTHAASARKLSPQMLCAQATAQTRTAEALAQKLDKSWEGVRFETVTKDGAEAEKARARFRAALHDAVDAYYG